MTGLVLASASPRRAHLLEQLGLSFRVEPAHVDETVGDESPEAHVERLALEKARVVARRHPDAVVVGGDTVVVLDGEIIGKPADPDEAVATLLRLQGRTHRVESGVAVVAGSRSASSVVGADVHFKPFDESVARAYVATGEPMDKAGAYGIQGRGAVLVDSIQGDYFSIMGLPLARLVELLEGLGHPYQWGT